jgi:hypothetical protein
MIALRLSPLALGSFVTDAPFGRNAPAVARLIEARRGLDPSTGNLNFVDYECHPQ